MNIQACERKWFRLNIFCEAKKSFEKMLKKGFFKKHLKGKVINTGHKGHEENTKPVIEWAIAIGGDLNYPGYDGKKLTFENESIDAVFPHMFLSIEYIEESSEAIKERFRLLKVGGYLMIIVLNKDFYEKGLNLSSRWNEDHKRFYTPSSLLKEIKESLKTNSYGIRHFEVNDFEYNYNIGPYQHSESC